jgi:hypothetical protein
MEGSTAHMLAMGAIKRIALVAHDNKKVDLLEWAAFNRTLLAQHALYATATTGRLLREALGLEVTALQSGPPGGRSADRRADHGGRDRLPHLLLGSASAAPA